MISANGRIRAVKELLLANLNIAHLDFHKFDPKYNGQLPAPPLTKGDQACHYIIKNETDEGRAGFHYECCGREVCSDKHEQKWLQFLMILIGELLKGNNGCELDVLGIYFFVPDYFVPTFKLSSQVS